ncbi:MAG: hypothetical protein EAZ50_02145 [Runella slithyformis]|jgi:hypothetical protein|nr:MAG: hypothetical protein EAY79_02425 [Runella slithyformis]TAF83072.1 MAG: hypothetical protein EAZ50_02145 [Runella slithyformis]
MKALHNYFWLLLLCGTSSAFSQHIPYQRNGLVNFVGYEKNVLTVVSEHAGETLEKAVNFAEINALETILFKGVPNSPAESPIISDEVEAMTKHPLVLRSFIFETGCRAYIKSSVIVGKSKKKKVHFVAQQVTFDLAGMRKFLEKNGVIKPFGL